MEVTSNDFNQYVTALRKPLSARSNAERAAISSVEGEISKFDEYTDDQKRTLSDIIRTAGIPAGVSETLRAQMQNIVDFSKTPKDSLPKNDEIEGFDFSELPANIKIRSQAADELSPAQIKLFNENLTKFIAQHMLKKSDANAALSPKERAVGVASFYTAACEQTTSTANANNKNLKNSFELDGVEYDWNYGDAFKFFGSAFSGESVDNPIRRYMKAMYNQSELVLERCGYQPTERMAAKWGVTSGNRRNIADFVPLHKARLTQDGMAAQHAATEYATSKRDGGGNKVHVMQTLGRSMRRN
nr:coat protein [Agapanthus velarivirus]